MKEYNAYESGWFKTELTEIKKLHKTFSWIFSKKFEAENLLRINKQWGKDAVEFTFRKVPYTRNQGDSAKLLIIKNSKGEYWAKRHNNSQWLSIV